MSKEECLHDCTCCETKTVDPLRVEARCDLPEGHTGDHWSPLWGWFDQVAR